MTGTQRDAAGIYDPHGTSANDGPHGNTGAVPAATSNYVPDHTAHAATAATAAMCVECQYL